MQYPYVKLVLAAVLAGATPAWSHGGAARPSSEALAHLDNFARGLAGAEGFSGVVLVARDGKVVFEKAYGKLDEKSGRPMPTDARFNLASAGKMFTAVAIFQQIAAGRLTLDTHVGEVLKRYPNRAFADNVTVRELLTHTAGAGDIDELFGYDNADVRARVHTVADMVALHSHRAPEFAPGSRQRYGNFGHVILGRMVEVLSGQDFKTYIREHVFAPAGMTHSGFADCTDLAPDIARGYATVDGRRVSNCLTQPTHGFPAGGELSTAGDMLRFVEALRAGKLMPRKLFAQATTTQREYMGLGFFATGYGPGVPKSDFRWGHGGGADGVCTDVRTYPKTGETIIVLSNRDAPACFPVANFLHAQWDARQAASRRNPSSG